jgi:excisionase family DNA binding protein
MLEFSLLNEKVLLSLKEFSVLAGLSLRTVSKLVSLREIKSIHVGRRRLISRSELERFAMNDHVLACARDLKQSRSSKLASRKQVGR